MNQQSWGSCACKNVQAKIKTNEDIVQSTRKKMPEKNIVMRE